MTMKIAAVVTVYHPDPVQLESNIRSYLPWVDHLIVWENTLPEESSLGNIAAMSDKLEIVSSGRNEYLAVPFNKCIQWAREHGCDYVLTMDQDSYFKEGNFSKYKTKIEACEEPSVAIFAPSTTRLPVDSHTQIYIEQGSVYSSGSIYKTALFDSIGEFREDFAIYCLDTEICMRVRQHGFRIAMFTDVFMQHAEGYKTKGIFGITINNYSAQSTYFYVRNNLLLWKIYPHNFNIATKFNFVKYHVLFRIIKMMFENNKSAKLKAIITGLRDGIITAV